VLNSLNKNQQLAVTTTQGPVLVLAGPGSGKTNVLTHRIAYLIYDQHTPMRNIMAVTFTNKAANEMRERVERIMDSKLRGMMLGTFHAICALILRREYEVIPYDRNFTIYDTYDQRSLVNECIERLNYDAKQHRPAAVLGAISKAKNEMIGPEAFVPETYRDQIVHEVYREYMRVLRVNNAMDFDDLLTQAVILFQQNPDVLARYEDLFHFVMVDEFQDTNMAQYELVRLLCQTRQNLFVVGDPDQSIYGFRGADYRNVRRFQKDFPGHTVITLDENYRSHQLILDAAMAVIRRNDDHIPRDLFSARKSGPLIEVHQLDNSFAEGDFIVSRINRLMHEEGYGLRDFAVMYRVNAQSRALENTFRDGGIAYQIVGGLRFYDRKEIKDALAYLHTINNPDDSQRLMRIINMPPRGIGKKSQKEFVTWAEARGDGYWVALKSLLDGESGPFASRALKSFRGFAKQLADWMAFSQRDDVEIAELMENVLADIDYEAYLSGQGTETEVQSRLENLQELRRELLEHEGFSLSEYLEKNALITDVDRLDPDEEAVMLMTLHAAKGLEFPVVFIAGVEDGLLPHSRSKDTLEGIAEERRLLYVGITRAKERLYMSYCSSSLDYSGFSTPSRPSEFLSDLPMEVIDAHQRGYQTRISNNPYARPAATTWNTPEEESKQPRFKAGDTVRHSIYGKGIVIKSMMTSGLEEVEIEFEEAGTKRMDGDFLTKV
jgi:DNA helicase-2/ATP-dependent DNA helicase PcrA